MKKKFIVWTIFLVIAIIAFGDSYAITKNDIIFKIRFTTRLNLPDSGWVWSIRSGRSELIAVADAIIETVSVTISSGTETYSLPSDCVKVRKVCRQAAGGGGCLDKMDDWIVGKVHEGMDLSVDPLQAWWQNVDADIKILGISPVPEATDTLIVTYRQEPRSTNVDYGSDSADVSLEEGQSYHAALVTICKAYAFEYADRYDKARYNRELFTSQLNRVRADLAHPPSEIFLAPRAVPREP